MNKLKADMVILGGGNTARATGLFACESPVQARERIVADKDELFQRAMHWAHWSNASNYIHGV